MDANSTAGIADMDIVKTFMRDVDVVSTVQDMDNIGDYLDLLDLFYTDGEKRSVLLPELLETQDLERYVINVHALKSAAANIGARSPSDLARQHEEAGKAKETDWLSSNSDALLRHYHEILAEICRVLGAWQYGRFAPRDLSGLPPIGDDELSARIQKALESLEDFDSKSAAAEVKTLLDHSIPDALRMELEKVQSCLKMYDDDAAEELLRGLCG